MTDFAPPTYANLGKGFKDLFKKKYEFDSVAKVVNKTDFGLTLTTQGTVFKSEIAGNLKAEYKDKSFGEAEGEVDTKSGKVWGKATLTTLVQNTKFITNLGFDPLDKDPLVKDDVSAKVEAEYRYGSRGATTASVLLGSTSKGVGAQIEAAQVVGLDGVSVGAKVKLRVDEEEPLKDWGVSAQYEKKQFIGTILTERKFDLLRFTYFQTVRTHLQIGGEILVDGTKPKVFTFASQYQIDPATLAKLRANNNGEVAAVVEHRLQNPKVQVGATAEYEISGFRSFAAKRFGISLTFGDF